MSIAVLYMSMSLDGFVAGPNESRANPLGDGGHRLHDWFITEDGLGRPAGVNGQIWDGMMATGAVVAGPGTFETAGGWGGDHHNGTPIFIYSRHEPGIDISDWPLVTYVSDVVTAITRAKRSRFAASQFRTPGSEALSTIVSRKGSCVRAWRASTVSTR